MDAAQGEEHDRSPSALLSRGSSSGLSRVSPTYLGRGGSWETMGDIYTRLALASGTALMAEVHGANSHERFDCTLENAFRLFDAIVCTDLAEGTSALTKMKAAHRQISADYDLDDMRLTSTGSLRRQESNDSPIVLMSRDQFRNALEQQGFHGLEGLSEFDALWDDLGAPQGGLDVQTFHAVLRHLKLRLLCSSSYLQQDLPDETGFVGIMDWSQRKLSDFYSKRPDRLLDMFLKHRSADMKMRWVHCLDVGRLTILRLAVKYQLHPLPVEDTIQLEQQTVPVVRKYNDNFFVVIPLLRLTPGAKRMLERYKEWRNTRPADQTEAAESNFFDVPEVEQCRLAIFAAGPPHYDTVISVMTKWIVSKLHGESTEQAVESDGNEVDIFNGVVRQIQRDYSMLRAGNSSWLLWRLLDVAVDELTPILSAYRAQLRWFSSLIAKQEAKVSKDVEKRLLRSKVELDWLQRKVRPMIKVIKHLIRDRAIDPDVTRYLEDIEDHLGTFLEEVSRIIGVCNSLRDEVHSFRDRQQSKVLYVLTLVTTLVMPTHLLTGIFGMNWQDENGQPVVPGLGIMKERRGFIEFWGTSFVSTVLIYFIFSRVLKWI